ncbi:Cytochrome c-type biogenesis protein CcmG/DsbE2C thiol:disulfide oxidoreductase [gamma proteobacterium IMCC2047]|nr:Cytochrome c-type biogenesis protein CcmG/DsbE2C thiol:disulfide oxidoreductase [gamma proteobacterium IMCC2047]
MKRVYLFVPLILFIALVVLFAKGLKLDPNDMPSALIDQSVPEFSLPSLASPDRLLTRADMVGEVSLVNVWGTWCPSCMHEHPYLMELSDQVPIIGINYKDVRDDALDWLDKLGNPYVLNVFDEMGTLGIDLGVFGAPETYVIDRKGYVRYKHVGVVSERVWLERLKPLVDELRGEK